jgi:hypothetical protein
VIFAELSQLLDLIEPILSVPRRHDIDVLHQAGVLKNPSQLIAVILTRCGDGNVESASYDLFNGRE